MSALDLKPIFNETRKKQRHIEDILTLNNASRIINAEYKRDHVSYIPDNYISSCHANRQSALQ